MSPASGCSPGGSRPSAEALLQMRQTVEVLRGEDGLVHLVLPGDRPDLEFDLTPMAEHLVACLDGQHTAMEIIASVADTPDEAQEVRVALDELWAGSALQDARDADELGPVEAERFDRQLRYIRDLAEPGDAIAERHQRLRAAHVVVLGVGGLGSWATLCLAAAGVGRLTLIDDDRVELSNLARQALFAHDDVGRKKVDAGARALRRIHPDVEVSAVDLRVRCADDLAEQLRDADIMVSAADWPGGRIDGWVDAACQETGTPSVSVGQHPPLIRFGPLLVPGLTACQKCRERALAVTHPIYEDLADLRATSSSQAATFAGTSAMLGGWAATEAVHHLTGLPTAGLGRAHILDVRDFSSTCEWWTRQAGCDCETSVIRFPQGA